MPDVLMLTPPQVFQWLVKIPLRLLRKYAEGMVKQCVRGIHEFLKPGFNGYIPWEIAHAWHPPLVRVTLPNRMTKLECILMINAWCCWVHESYKKVDKKNPNTGRTFEDLIMFSGESYLIVAKHLQRVVQDVGRLATKIR